MEGPRRVLGRLWKNRFGVHFDGLFGPPGGPWKIDLEARTVDFVRDASNETARMTSRSIFEGSPRGGKRTIKMHSTTIFPELAQDPPGTLQNSLQKSTWRFRSKHPSQNPRFWPPGQFSGGPKGGSKMHSRSGSNFSQDPPGTLPGLSWSFLGLSWEILDQALGRILESQFVRISKA